MKHGEAGLEWEGVKHAMGGRGEVEDGETGVGNGWEGGRGRGRTQKGGRGRNEMGVVKGVLRWAW